MEKIDEQAERGITLAAEMLGPKFGENMRAHISSGGFASAIARNSMVHAYTDCWSRPGLTRQQRSLVTIAALIGLRQPNELRNHIRIGVANGLTVREIEEILIQLSTYVGYPAIASATTAVVEVLRELGLALDARTSEERGVL